MKRLAQLLSWLALAATLAVACLFLVDKLDLATMQRLMLVAAAAWFVSAPFWVDRKGAG